MQSLNHDARILAVGLMFTGVCAIAQAAGLAAELRSAGALIPAGTTGAVAPSALAGAVVTGTQAWYATPPKGSGQSSQLTT